jgi:rhodanese-related sulfurtransferase
VPAFADRQKPLLVYCKTGGRAALAVLNLQRMGYSGALCITGGIESWRSQGLPLTRDDTHYGA